MDEKSRRAARVVGLLIAGFSALLIGIVLWGQARQMQAHRTFHPTQGKIIENRLETSTGGRTPSTHPLIRFRYEVNGRSYESTTLSLGGKTFGGRGDMSAYVSKYPRGATVEVYYDPADPSVAILDRTVDSVAYPLLVGAGFILAGLAISAYGFRVGQRTTAPAAS